MWIGLALTLTCVCRSSPVAQQVSFWENETINHSGLAAKMPGLVSFTTSWTRPGPDGDPPPLHLIGAQEWPDEAALDACLAGPQIAAAVADLANLDAPKTMLVCRTHQIV
jgi:hypothetical protein